MIVDYLVSGFRISVGPRSTTPGPRTHILGLTEALRLMDHEVRLTLVSDVPGLGRFAEITESSYTNTSSAKIWLADGVRIGASLWAGIYLFGTGALTKKPHIIIERGGVLQSLASFHPYKRRAVRIVEANGIYSRETALDRKVLKSKRLATALERHMFRAADFVVAVSENLKTELVDFAGLSPDNVLVVPNATASSLGQVERLPTDKCIIGFVGALSQWQHLDRFVQVFAANQAELTAKAGKPVSLEIIGDGVDAAMLLNLVDTDELRDNVTLWGAEDHGAALQTMRRWNIGFAGHERSSSSTMYHSPLKLYEYGGLGLAMVCTPSADAEGLRASGVPTFIYSSEEEMAGALIQAAQFTRSDSAEAIAERRNAVQREHGWGDRVARILDRARA